MLALHNNENPLGPSLLAHAAATHALTAMHSYPDEHYAQLRKALAEFHAIRPEHFTLGNGSEQILEWIIKTYLQAPTQHALISQYTFLTIPMILKQYGVPTQVIATEQYRPHLTHLLEAIDAHTRVLFLVNPNNPTGIYLNEASVTKLMGDIPQHVLVVIDEAYIDYVHPRLTPAAAQSGALPLLTRFPNLIITRTFSKVYGLAGLRLGYAISSAEIADQLTRIQLPYPVNRIAALAGMAALKDETHLKKSVLLNRAGMQQLENGLSSLNMRFIPSHGNFMMILVDDALTVSQQLYDQGIQVKPLNAYGLPKHIRVTIGTDEQNARFLNTIRGLKP